MNQSQKVYTVVGATSAIAVSAIVGFVLFATPDSTTSRSGQLNRVVSAPATSSSPVSVTGTYKDGVFTADANYEVPDGQNTLTLKVTVASGKITAVEPTSDYQSGESARYIGRFDRNISGVVVGQPIDGLSVDRVGGASLTSAAFNDALDTIRNEAKS
jgi:uncharacterized protein with FMN-binding domain